MDRTREANSLISARELSEGGTMLASYPNEFHFALTNICNLKCMFCNFNGPPMKSAGRQVHLGLESLTSVARFMDSATYVNISGRGEPLLYPHVIELLGFARTNGFLDKIHIITNGVFLRRFDMKQLNGIAQLAVSFDGGVQKTFEFLRNGASWNVTLDGIKTLRRTLPDLNMGFNVTVNRLNIDELSQIAGLARSLGLNFVNLNAVGGYVNPLVDILRLRKSDSGVFNSQMSLIREQGSGNPAIHGMVA
ncbi:MAG: radical SAM protein, partial [Myxococcota bacterium]